LREAEEDEPKLVVKTPFIDRIAIVIDQLKSAADDLIRKCSRDQCGQRHNQSDETMSHQ
jgi:hypothetical protein